MKPANFAHQLKLMFNLIHVQIGQNCGHVDCRHFLKPWPTCMIFWHLPKNKLCVADFIDYFSIYLNEIILIDLGNLKLSNRLQTL